jgi:hypothetical protein
MSSTVWRSSHPVISPRCVHAWRGARLSGRLGTVAVHREWVAGRRYTVVAYCELPVDWRCPIAVLQNPCPHVLLAFNVPPTPCLACAWYQPCCVASWKIRARPNGRS